MKKSGFKSLLKKIRPYAVPGIITGLVMIVILILKGIWPFGSSRIDYFDNMQQVAPLYAHLWDFMHGKASIWFDWYTGLGTNVSMSISAFSMITPFNLLLYFVPRSYILESISIITLVKMIFMSVAMYALINKKYNNLVYGLKVMFSCMYAFCGYVILYGSCFTPWMDIVAFFPILIMAYDRMLETGKKMLYICMIALCFIINYYLSAMSLIYIFLICGIRMETWLRQLPASGVSSILKRVVLSARISRCRVNASITNLLIRGSKRSGGRRKMGMIRRWCIM